MGAAQPNESNGGLGGRVATPARLVSPLAPSNKSLAQTNKSPNGVNATKRYRPEGNVGEAKETAHFSHHCRVKRLSLICSANSGPGRASPPPARASCCGDVMTSEDRLLLILRRLDEIERKLDHVLDELRTPTAIGYSARRGNRPRND